MGCHEGTYFSDGSYYCSDWLAGTFSPSNSSTCFNCPAGKTSKNDKWGSNTNCPAGTYSEEASTLYIKCPGGTYLSKK